MQRVKAAGPTVKGIDLSHYQSGADFSVLAKQEIGFAHLKLTQGISIKDKTYRTFEQECESIKMLHGAYHFLDSSLPGLDQADFFVNTLQGGRPNFVIMDWETLNGQKPQDACLVGLNFMARIKQSLNMMPIVYGSPSFLQALSLPEPANVNPLWIAEYGPSAPFVPTPWVDWFFWQYSNKATVPGVPGGCDVDLFNGDMARLQNFVKSLQL